MKNLWIDLNTGTYGHLGYLVSVEVADEEFESWADSAIIEYGETYGSPVWPAVTEHTERIKRSADSGLRRWLAARSADRATAKVNGKPMTPIKGGVNE